MSATYEDNNRQTMPRCIDYATAACLGLLRAIKSRQIELGNLSSNARDEWLRNPTIFTAVDLLSEAIIIKDFASDEPINSAKFILSKAPQSFKFIRELAHSFLQETPPSDPVQSPSSQELHHKRIAKLKRTVRLYPYNPIAWSELSLCYATLGQTDKSRVALQVALNIGGNNRFILRSAARCLVHMGEPDRSVWLLNRSGVCTLDPWIASAEIAICESLGLKSKCVTKGKYLLQDDNLTDFSRSELAVGMGTIQMKHGNVRHAKKLMKQALRDPTENALAQAQWMTTHLGTDIGDIADIVKLEDQVPGSYEAQARRFFYKLDFPKSLEASQLWARFQQLSSRPVIEASFIASAFLGDDKKAISILTSSMPAQKNGFLFTNNYAFSLVNSGQLEAGIRQLATINVNSLSRREKLTLQATEGLVSFRTGEVEKGRKLYSMAIDGFAQTDAANAALAAYFLACEEKRIGSEVAKSKIDEVKARIAKLKLPPFDFLAKKL